MCLYVMSIIDCGAFSRLLGRKRGHRCHIRESIDGPQIIAQTLGKYSSSYIVTLRQGTYFITRVAAVQDLFHTQGKLSQMPNLYA